MCTDPSRSGKTEDERLEKTDLYGRQLGCGGSKWEFSNWRRSLVCTSRFRGQVAGILAAQHINVILCLHFSCTDICLIVWLLVRQGLIRLTDKPCRSQQAPVLEAVTGASSSFQSGSRQSLQVSAGCWWEASVPHPQDLSRRLLENSWHGSRLHPELMIQASGFDVKSPCYSDSPGMFLLHGKRRGFWRVNLVEGTKYGQ